MPDPKSARSGFNAIILACKQQLITVAGIPEECILIVARGKVPHFQADQDVVLRAKGFQVRKEVTDQAGLWDIRIRRKIEARCRTRLALDDASRDEIRLTDLTLGHTAFEELVATTLMGNPNGTPFFPTDAAGNALTAHPLLLDDGDGPDPDPEQGKEADWIETKLHFWIEYSLASAAYPSGT